MNNHLALLVKRYLLPIIIALAGIVLIIIGISTNQGALYTVAAINLLIGGALAILFSTGILKRNIVLIIGFICILITVGVGFKTKQNLDETIQHQKDFARSVDLYRFQLKQIRAIERAYKGKYGIYASSFEELKSFYLHDSIQKIDASGIVPARKLTLAERDVLYDDNRALDQNMTEREAALLAALGNPTNSPDLEGFKRDTIMVAYKTEFMSSSARNSKREALGLGEFTIDKLQYIPMTNPKEKWTIETRDSVPYLNDTIPTIHVYGKAPIPRYQGGDRITVGFGSLETSSDEATWE